MEILDSRGNLTIQVSVVLESGAIGLQRSLRELQPGNMRRSSFGMGTRSVTTEKEY